MAEFDNGLDAIARSDRMIEALAAGHPVQWQDSDDHELAALLGGWRDEARRAPLPRVAPRDVVAALEVGQQQTHRRPRYMLTVLSGAAAAVVVAAGFGAVVYDAHPGDALYGVRTALFGETDTLRSERFALAAQSELTEVKQLIDQGQWQQAQAKLQAMSTTVKGIDDASAKQEVVEQWNRLAVQVETRDPNASLPVSEPGEPAPPPLSLTLPPEVIAPPTPTTPTTSTPTPTTSTPTTPPSSEQPTTPTTPSSTPSSSPVSTPPSTPTSSVVLPTPSSPTSQVPPPSSPPQQAPPSSSPAPTRVPQQPPPSSRPAPPPPPSPRPAPPSSPPPVVVAPEPPPVVVAPPEPPPVVVAPPSVEQPARTPTTPVAPPQQRKETSETG